MRATMFTHGHAGSGNLLNWHEVTMTQYKEFQGKTLDDAIREACEYYGVARAKLEIEIVSDAKTGIFGLVGVKKATIRAARVQLGDAVSQLLEAPASEAAQSAQEGGKGAKRRSGADARPESRGSGGAASFGGRKSAPEPQPQSQPQAEKQGDPDLRDNSRAGSDVTAREPGGEKAEPEARSPGIAKSEPEARRSGGTKSSRTSHGGSGGQGRTPSDAAQTGADAETDRDEGHETPPHANRAPSRKGIASGRGRAPGGALRPARGGASAREGALGRAGERDSARGRGPAGDAVSGAEAAEAARRGQDRHPASRTAVPVPGVEEQADALEGLRDDLPDFDLENCDRERLFAVVSGAVLRLAAPIVGQVPCVVSVGGRRVRASLDCGEASGLLVGRDGQTLAAIEYLAARIVSRQLGGAVRLQVDAGKYRERQDDKLKELALSLAAKARESGRSQSTRPLSAYQRRIVHLALEGDATVQTRSKGEGAQRRVVILPRRESPAQSGGLSGKGMTAGAESRPEQAAAQAAPHKSVDPSVVAESGPEHSLAAPAAHQPPFSLIAPVVPAEEGIRHAVHTPTGRDALAADTTADLPAAGGAEPFTTADGAGAFPAAEDAGLLAGAPETTGPASAAGSADAASFASAASATSAADSADAASAASSVSAVSAVSTTSDPGTADASDA